MGWIDIFSQGPKTSRQGVTQDFPLERLASVVQSFNPQKFRPPLIVRHDTKGVPDAEIANQAFCFGVPKELKIFGDKLKARFDGVSPEFREWVKNGNLISVSSSFYAEDDPRNPSPGNLTLRHIAALGADLPADKNLSPLSEILEYSDEDAHADEYQFVVDESWLQEFEEPGFISQIKEIVEGAVLPVVQSINGLAPQAIPLTTSRLEGPNPWPKPPEPTAIQHKELEYMDWDKLVAWAIRSGVSQSGKSPAEIATAADITPERLDVILGKNGEPSYEETEKIIQALGLDLEFVEPSPRELAFRQREADLIAREAQLRRQQVIEFTEPLVADGRLLPGDRAALEGILLALDATNPIEFAEGEATVSKAPAEALRDWMARLKPQIEFAEIAGAEDDDEIPSYIDFVEPPGMSVPPAKRQEYARVKNYQQKHGVTLSQAMQALGVQQ